jgi:hypothetical protein
MDDCDKFARRAEEWPATRALLFDHLSASNDGNDTPQAGNEASLPDALGPKKLSNAPKPTASSRNTAEPTIEIADGSGVVKKKGFGNRGAADAWIAAQKPASADLPL